MNSKSYDYLYQRHCKNKISQVNHCTDFFVVLLPFGNLIGKCLPDPLNFNGIGKVAEDIITERTKANGHSKLNVRVKLLFLLLCQKYKISNRQAVEIRSLLFFSYDSIRNFAYTLFFMIYSYLFLFYICTLLVLSSLF